MDIIILVLIVSIFVGAFIYMGYYVAKFIHEPLEDGDEITEYTNEDFDDTLKSEN